MSQRGFYRELLTGSFVEIGQKTVCKGVDAKSGNVITDIYEELVPAFCLISLLPVLDCIPLMELERYGHTGFMRAMTPTTN